MSKQPVQMHNLNRPPLVNQGGASTKRWCQTNLRGNGGSLKPTTAGWGHYRNRQSDPKYSNPDIEKLLRETEDKQSYQNDWASNVDSQMDPWDFDSSPCGDPGELPDPSIVGSILEEFAYEYEIALVVLVCACSFLFFILLFYLIGWIIKLIGNLIRAIKNQNKDTNL